MLLLLTMGVAAKTNKTTFHFTRVWTEHDPSHACAAFIMITCILDQLLLDVLQGQAGLIPEPRTISKQHHAPQQDHCTMQ